MIYHLWSKFISSDSETLRRQSLACSTWNNLPWTDCAVEDQQLVRKFKCGNKQLPYLKDMFEFACKGKDVNDIIVFSNSDIGFSTNACVRIALALQSNDAGYAFRRDFGRLDKVPSDAEICNGNDYAGTDVFFFRVEWWRCYGPLFPDMLIAREAWDACLRVLIEQTNHDKPLSLPNLCWHERHGGSSYWEDPVNRYTLPGQKHNLSLAKAFMYKNGHNPSQFGIR